MILACDVGNTQTVLGLFDGDDLTEHWRLSTDRNRTGDEFAIQVGCLLHEAGLGAGDVSGVVISSVVPSLKRTLRDGLAKAIGVEPRFLSHANCSVRLDVMEPHAVGADRMANTIAAHAMHGGPCLVIDFGTAVNFDLVDGTGAFLGGAIAPEMQLAANALTERAAQLHSIPLEVPPSVVGKTTVENLQAGIVLGYLDLVDGLIRRFRSCIDDTLRVIATGGKARLFAEHLEEIDEYAPFLTLRGLYIWSKTA